LSAAWKKGQTKDGTANVRALPDERPNSDQKHEQPRLDFIHCLSHLKIVAPGDPNPLGEHEIIGCIVNRRVYAAFGSLTEVGHSFYSCHGPPWPPSLRPASDRSPPGG
jgi:hypothetical protein